jgi:hypothetical protein
VSFRDYAKRTAERFLGFVPDAPGYRTDAQVGRPEQVVGEVHPPLGQVRDRNDLGRLLPAHQMVVAIGQRDDIAPVRPMPFAAGQRDPASPRRDDVEQDHALRPGDGGPDEIYAGARFLDRNGNGNGKVESNRIVDDL